MLICSLNAHAIDNKAVRYIQRAALSYSKVRTVKKKIEKKTLRYITSTGITKRQIATTFALVKTAIDNEVTTENINMNVDFLGAKIRPVIRYNWQTNTGSTEINMNWGF
jgi:hypothetical protein